MAVHCTYVAQEVENPGIALTVIGQHLQNETILAEKGQP
jgi:hypothetical protein